MCISHATNYASSVQLNHQNRSLKRKSMMLLSHLSPDTIAEINLEDEEEEEEKEEDGKDSVPSGSCLSPYCHTTISGTLPTMFHSVPNLPISLPFPDILIYYSKSSLLFFFCFHPNKCRIYRSSLTFKNTKTSFNVF